MTGERLGKRSQLQVFNVWYLILKLANEQVGEEPFSLDGRKHFLHSISLCLKRLWTHGGRVGHDQEMS